MTKSRIYTTEIHELQIKSFLEDLPFDSLCRHCPVKNRHLWENDVCIICREFSGVKPGKEGLRFCPCSALGTEEAVRRAKQSFGLHKEEEKP